MYQLHKDQQFYESYNSIINYQTQKSLLIVIALKRIQNGQQ